MKLGPRIALVTTVLMAMVAAVAILAVLDLRRVELGRDLDRQARELAYALSAGIEPVTPALAGDVMAARVNWARQRGGLFELEALATKDLKPTDATWASLVEAARQADAPVGRLFAQVRQGQRPVYVMAVPLHNAPPDDPARQAVAFLGLKRDSRYIDDEVAATARRLLPFLFLGVLLFGGAVYLLLTRGVVTPLRRLIDALDAVSKGDLDRALLPEREDEIGSLAARFNVMTQSLRRARDDEGDANAARLTLETRLRHAEKLATIGQLAAEIAHEVGTPLNVIGGRARSLGRRATDPAEVQKNADIISTQVDRITRIIRQVLDFSRKNRPTLTQVDVRRVVTEALGFVDETLRKSRIEARIQASADLPPVPGDPDEIQQVCLNLLLNAIHAMPGGGKLDVAVQVVARRKEGLALAPPASFLMIQVADSGEGIPPADREKIFEAFFTTKDTGEGTGLGLAVAKGIVKDHDGWIDVDDKPGGGAIFRVFLPLLAHTDDT